RIHDGINRVRVARREGQPDAAEVSGRQAACDFLPRLPAVRTAMNRGAWATVDDGPYVSPALITRGNEHVGVARIEDDIGNAGISVDGENAFPCPAPVGRLVKTALTAATPERTLCRDVNRLGITRIEHDAADVFTLLEPDICPRLASIRAFVNAIAITHAS